MVYLMRFTKHMAQGDAAPYVRIPYIRADLFPEAFPHQGFVAPAWV
jgi:hypothetical protein